MKSLGERKSVVHAEGGIVAAIHVKDGDRVTVGQTLVTLADERVAASAQALREQGAAQALKAQRLQAETTGAPFVPDVQALQGFAMDGDTAHLQRLAGRERELFTARARQQAEQTHWLAEQLAQTRREIATQQELIATTDSARKLTAPTMPRRRARRCSSRHGAEDGDGSGGLATSATCMTSALMPVPPAGARATIHPGP